MSGLAEKNINHIHFKEISARCKLLTINSRRVESYKVLPYKN